ncbi:hypothetical protein Leryth_010113, partial [Lithospermum erythrorhizon]
TGKSLNKRKKADAKRRLVGLNLEFLVRDPQIGLWLKLAAPCSPPRRKKMAPRGSRQADCATIDFTQDYVQALLNEKLKTKNMKKCDLMSEYIRKLKHCINCFQHLQADFVSEKDRLNTLLQLADSKCSQMENLMNAKQLEFNSIIAQLNSTIHSLELKSALEESAKLEALDSFISEKDARLVAEKLQSSISDQLARAQEDNATSNKKILSLNDTYKRLQEYNTSLQQYNSKLQLEIASINETLKRVEKEKAAVVENLSTLRGHYTCIQEQLTSSRTSQDDTLRKKESLTIEVQSLRGELQQVREDRDRQLLRVQTITKDFETHKEQTAEWIAKLDILTSKSNQLEMSNMSEHEARIEYEEQNKLIFELQNRLAEAEGKIREGDQIRKKLHNTILELKGNIRVFCRVRPFLFDEVVSTETKVVSFPTSPDTIGRGIDLTQNGQTHCFSYDKVFTSEASQDDVFVEISQLVQSALDGYKVCIFAYGQTGSGKTYTMMGKPGIADQKGLIPRSLEQVFETRQTLQLQGWKYDMQVSMLEIYNETIRDLLSPNRPNSDVSRIDNMGKQYAIKHDANGNTHVSDLTIVDVRSSKEVSYLLDRAAQSRSVGKTQMNEESSRSHFVFTLRISGVNESTDQQVQGVLNLIDLAGSERLSKSGATGDRLKETQAINKSLSSLSDVIFALGKKDEHVPFRNSKLTYLLQPCLGGDSKTLMFVNVSPDPSSVGESLCSLRFASRVNACEIGIPRRQTNMHALDSRLSTS